jgi:ABC-type lipoprotein release transport system permease subunit
MKTFIIIAWRNIWRQKRRSLVVIASIGIGVLAMIISIALMNGFNTQMVENTINTSLGHVAIHRSGYQDNMKLEKNFLPDEKIYSSIRGIKSVKAYAPRVKVQGMVRSSEASEGVFIIGIDPEMEKNVSMMYFYTLKTGGSSFLSDPAGESVLISRSLAKKLDLLIGDKLIVMLQNKKNEIVGIGFTIRGFYVTPIESFDKYMVFVGITKLQEVTGIGGNISEINIITKSRDDVDSTKMKIQSLLNNVGLEVLSWKDMAPNLVSSVELFDNLIWLFFMIIFITVVFSIANTLIMAIMERFHEIGVMKAIGTRPSQVFFLIIFEAINLGFVGLVFGAGIGIVLVTFFSIVGIDLSAFSETMRVWGSGSIIYPVIVTNDLLMSMSIVLMTTILAALYPAVKAAKIKPLEALTYI